MTETMDETRHPGSELFPDERLVTTEVLEDASTLVAAAIDKLAIQRAGLDAATAELLMRLARSPSCGIRGVDIGAQCQMTATRVSRLVDRAEVDGFVKRTPDPTDRRAQQVALTEAGYAAAARLAPLMDDLLETLVFETLTAQERTVLIELLGKLVGRAREMLEDA